MMSREIFDNSGLVEAGRRKFSSTNFQFSINVQASIFKQFEHWFIEHWKLNENCKLKIENSLRSRPGFTTVELIVVLTIFVLTVSVAVPFAGNYLQASTLQSTEQDLVQVLGRARHRAVTGKQGSAWGVYVEAHAFTLYAGNTYAVRNSELDELHEFTDGYTFSGASEITFAKGSGTADPSGTVTITHGGAGEVSVIVNSVGGISIQ